MPEVTKEISRFIPKDMLADNLSTGILMSGSINDGGYFFGSEASGTYYRYASR